MRDIAILSLRYPISHDTFSGRLTFPQNGAIPRLALGFTQAHLYDTPFCYISRDNCAIQKNMKESFGIIATSIARYEKYRCWVQLSWMIYVYCPSPVKCEEGPGGGVARLGFPRSVPIVSQVPSPCGLHETPSQKRVSVRRPTLEPALLHQLVLPGCKCS